MTSLCILQCHQAQNAPVISVGESAILSVLINVHAHTKIHMSTDQKMYVNKS